MIIKLQVNGEFIQVIQIARHRTQSECKIQLTLALNFISSKPDFNETRTIVQKLIM